MVFVTVHLASNLAAHCLFLVLCLFTLFADYFQFDAFTVQLTGLRHELRYEDVYINSWTSFSDFSTYGCTYSNNDKVRTACSNIGYFRIAGVLYLFLVTAVLGAILLSMLSLYLRMLGKENQLSRMKLPHLLAAPGFCLAGAEYLWVSNVDHLTHPDGSREEVEREPGITLLFVTAFVGILTLLHYLFLKHYRHIEDIGFSFKLFEEIQEREDRIRDLERDQKDYVALIQDLGDLKHFLGTPGSAKPVLRTLIAGDVQRVLLELWIRLSTDDKSTHNVSMAVDSAEGLVDRLSGPKKLRVGSAASQAHSPDPEPADPQTEELLRVTREKDELSDQVERLNRQIEELERQRIIDAENFEAAEKEKAEQQKAQTMKLDKLRGKNQKLRSAAPPSARPAEDNRDEHVAMQRQEIDELSLMLEDLRRRAAKLEEERDAALRRSEDLAAELECAEKTLETLRSDLDALEEDRKEKEGSQTEAEKLRLLVISLREEADKQGKDRSAADRELADLRRQIEELERERAGLLERLQMTSEDLGRMGERAESLQKEVADLQLDRDVLERENDDLKQALMKRSEDLSARLRDIAALHKAVKDAEERGCKDREDKEALRKMLAEAEALTRERDQMSAEEVQAWKDRVNETASSASDQLSQRDSELERLSRVLIDLRAKHGADTERLNWLWAMRLEDAGSIAEREREKALSLAADAQKKDAEVARLQRKNDELRRAAEELGKELERLRSEKGGLERENSKLKERLEDALSQLQETTCMSAEETTTWRIIGHEEKAKVSDSASESAQDIKRLTLLIQSLKAAHGEARAASQQQWKMVVEDAASAVHREREKVAGVETELAFKDAELQEDQERLEAATRRAEDLRRELERLRRQNSDLARGKEAADKELAETRSQLQESAGMAGEEESAWRLRWLEARATAKEGLSASEQELSRLTVLLQSLKTKYANDLEKQRLGWLMRLEDANSATDRERAKVVEKEAEIAQKDCDIEEMRQAIEDLQADLDRLQQENAALEQEREDLDRRLSEKQRQLAEVSSLFQEEARAMRSLLTEMRAQASADISASDSAIKRLALVVGTLSKENEELKAELCKAQADLRKESASTQSEADSLARLKEELEKSQSEAEELQAQLTGERAKRKAETEQLRAQLEEERESARTEEEKLRAQLAEGLKEAEAKAERLRELAEERQLLSIEIEVLRRNQTSLYGLIESLERSLMQEQERSQQSLALVPWLKEQIEAATSAQAELDTLRPQLAAARLLAAEVEGLQRALEEETRQLQTERDRREDSEAARDKAQAELEDALQQLSALQSEPTEVEAVWRERLCATREDFHAYLLRLLAAHRKETEELHAASAQLALEIGGLKDEKETLEQEIETLTYEVDQLRGDISEMSVTHDEVQAQNLELQHDVENLESRVKDLDQQRAEYRELISRLKQQIELKEQVYEGKLTEAAKDFETEKDEIIEEFSNERRNLQEEIERLGDELAHASEMKEQQESQIEWLGEEKDKLDEDNAELKSEVQRLLARQKTLIDWLGAVWEDKEATDRQKDEIAERYTQEKGDLEEKMLQLRDEFDRYKRDQDSWNKSLLSGEEQKMAQSVARIKELEARLAAEQQQTKQLDEELQEAKRQKTELAKQMQNLEDEKEKLREEVADLQQVKTVAESLRAELEAKAAEVESLERLRRENKERIAELTAELERLRQDLESQRARATQAEAQLRESQDKAMRLANHVATLQDENAALDTKVTEQASQIDDLERKVLALQLEIQRLQQMLARADRDLTALKPWPQKAKLAETELAATRHQLAMKAEELDAVRADLSAVSEHNEELSLENEKLRADAALSGKDKATMTAALGEAQRLKREKEEDQRQLRDLQAENQELHDLTQRLQPRLAELEAALKTSAEESAALKGRIREANNDREKLKAQISKLKSDHQQALAAQGEAKQSQEDERAEEREALRKAEEDLDGLRGHCGELEKLLDDMRREVQDKLAVIADLEAKQSRYKKELARRKRVALLKLLLKDWEKTLQLKMQKAVNSWRLRLVPQKPLTKPRVPEIVISSEEPAVDRFQLLRLSSLEGELTDPEIKAGEALVQEEKNVLLRDNLIISTFKAAGLRESPLAFVNVFKFFEELMDKKFEVDHSDLLAGRKPRGMTEFMMEHLNRMFGLKNLAVKFLCQLLPALQMLYKQGHPYGSLFARLLQVFHKDPISFKLGLFLARVRVRFNGLVEKMEKERSVQSSGRVLGRKKQNLTSQQMFELAASGGEAFLSDVIFLVYEMFEQDKSYGELMLKLIKPPAIDISDFIIFKICHKMAKLGLTPESLYDLIDVKREQNLLREEFIQGVQQTMDLWVDRTDLQTLFTIIDQNTSDTVSRDEFALKINFDSYYFNAKNEYYVVSKSTFLNSLADVYNEMYRNHAARLRMVYMEVGRKEMNLTMFRQVVMSIDPRYDLSKIDQMYSEAMKMYGGGERGLGMEGFCKMLLQHGVGVMQLFETLRLEEAVERKSMGGGLDISLTSEGELVSLSSRRRSPVA